MEDRKDIFNNSNNKMPKGGKPRMFRFNLYWMYGLIFMMLIALYMTNDSSDSKELGWTEFQRLAQENVFEKITVYNKKNLVEATVKKDKQEQVFGTKDITKLGTSPKAYVKIPSADKFSDFYDKAVAENRIDTAQFAVALLYRILFRLCGHCVVFGIYPLQRLLVEFQIYYSAFVENRARCTVLHRLRHVVNIDIVSEHLPRGAVFHGNRRTCKPYERGIRKSISDHTRSSDPYASGFCIHPLFEPVLAAVRLIGHHDYVAPHG